MVIISPLSVPVSKGRVFTLNLNAYRNTHYQALNNAKKAYKAAVAYQIELLPRMEEVMINYRLYPKTRRLTDIGNVVSIHKKFFEDALVEMGKIEDDNYLHVIGSSESFGAVDKVNPRVEITIMEVMK
jgi:hypothetical protein